MFLFSHAKPLSPSFCNTQVCWNVLKISLNCHYCFDVTAVADEDIGIALTSQRCHMPDIGTPASFELV